MSHRKSSKNGVVDIPRPARILRHLLRHYLGRRDLLPQRQPDVDAPVARIMMI